MTIQLVIPPDLLLDDTHDTSKPRLHTRVLIASSTPGDTLPTLSSLLPNTIRPSKDLIFLLPFHPTTHHPAPDDIVISNQRLYYPPLEQDKPIFEVLKGTAFVEFPSIELMQKEAWLAQLGEARVRVVPPNQGIGVGEGRGRDSGWAGAGKRRSGGEDVGSLQQDKRVKPDISVPNKANVVKPGVQANTLAGLLAYGSDDEVDDEGL